MSEERHWTELSWQELHRSRHHRRPKPPVAGVARPLRDDCQRLAFIKRSTNYWGYAMSDEEVEFLKAIERYKRENHRPFPQWHEVLKVVHELGYRKVEPPQPAKPSNV